MIARSGLLFDLRLLGALVLLAPALGVAADGAGAPPEERLRIVPYVGAAIAGGDGWVMVDHATSRSLGLAGELRGGLALHPRLTVDLTAAILTLGQSYRFPSRSPVLAIRLATVYAAASLFPLDDAMFLRAGLGHGWLSATNGMDAPAPSLAATGLAVTAGAGYRLWIADQASVTLTAQAFLHRYGNSGMKADAVTLSIGCDYYFGRARAGTP